MEAEKTLIVPAGTFTCLVYSHDDSDDRKPNEIGTLRICMSIAPAIGQVKHELNRDEISVSALLEFVLEDARTTTADTLPPSRSLPLTGAEQEQLEAFRPDLHCKLRLPNPITVCLITRTKCLSSCRQPAWARTCPT